MDWNHWITSQWSELAGGGKMDVPRWLPHPRTAGFRPIDVATPSGQCFDWGVPVSDGSRIHVHEFPDGQLVAHRDRYDPSKNFGNLVAHLLTETFVGPVAAVVLGLVIVGRLQRA